VSYVAVVGLQLQQAQPPQQKQLVGRRGTLLLRMVTKNSSSSSSSSRESHAPVMQGPQGPCQRRSRRRLGLGRPLPSHTAGITGASSWPPLSSWQELGRHPKEQQQQQQEEEQQQQEAERGTPCSSKKVLLAAGHPLQQQGQAGQQLRRLLWWTECRPCCHMLWVMQQGVRARPG
jgi:hypothetical protein